MEVDSLWQDNVAVCYVDREESFKAEQHFRVKRATLRGGKPSKGVDSVFDAFFAHFRTTFSFPSSTKDSGGNEAGDAVNYADHHQSSLLAGQGSSGPDGRGQCSELEVRSVPSSDAASVSAASSDWNSSYPDGPTSQHITPSDNVHTGATGADAGDSEGTARVGQSLQDSSTLHLSSADQRQDTLSHNDPSLTMDTHMTHGTQNGMHMTHGTEDGTHMTLGTEDGTHKTRGTENGTHLTGDSSKCVERPGQEASEDVLEPDDKPLIDSQDTDDSGQDLSDVTQGDQENRDPSKMPLSSLFKTTKAKKKSKKGKGKDKDLTQSNATDDVTNKDAAPTEEQPQTAAAPVASEISVTPPSDEVVPAEGAETMRDSVDEVPAEGGQNVTDEQGSEDAAHASDSKTDVSGADDTPAVLNTTESREITMTMGEGPQLTQSEGDVVETQPIKADGSLPPERAGREKESLLHDHNPEGMICCVIL